ncbi:SCO-spondin isoform X2 [Hydra vulgaris]|uniref:SCO-spondin isoform X2 n=1 Tax=Hydra vulgaris TaxID=6087 RepID=UPI001F5F957B|nr:SCO-spondin isoform X2 [Hydra vulgaris]
MKYLSNFYFIFLLGFSIVQAQILTQWTTFSDCSATCNVGNPIRTRTRTCTPQNLCQGVPLFDTAPCNTQYACPEYKLGDWGYWSACSESCRATQSNPTRVRTRSYCLSNSTSSYLCTLNYMVSFETCNTASCLTVKSCNNMNFTFVFVLDSSSSVDDENWESEKNVVLSFVSSSTFGVNQNVDVAVVNFGTTAQIEVECGTFKSYTSFATFMNNLKMLGGETAIHKGLTYGKTAFQKCQKLNMYPVIILLTDGYENMDMNIDSNIIIEDSIKKEALVVAGVTHEYNKGEIDRITSYIVNGQNVSFSFYANDFTNLLSSLGSTLYSFVVENSQCETQGQWTVWSTWGTCSQVCGATGYIQRSRSCINPTTKTVQEDCELDGYKANLDFATCFQQCGTYGAWSAWSSCSETCQSNTIALPFQTQTRDCLGSTGCSGPSSQNISCNVGVSCPGVMSPWSAWGQCSATCQLTLTAPTQQRSRICEGTTLGGNCNGQSTVASQTCSTGIYCPGTISDWSMWGACSDVCNNLVTPPYQTRSRSCIGYSSWDPNYYGCPGISKTEQLPCNTFVGCLGNYGAWSSWSSCSETCQSKKNLPPFQTQTRQCVGSTLEAGCSGPSSQTVACNVGVSCPGIISSWGPWGQCSATCQLTSTLPTQQRSRICVGATLEGNCNGQATVDSQTCSFGVYCPGTISDWSLWGACSDVCNNLVTPPYQTRSRSCIGYSSWDPNYFGCPGISKTEQQPCNTLVGCSGTYGTWSAWSVCSETCQSNTNMPPFQTQTRQCLGSTLGVGCSGPSSQTTFCNNGTSCPGILSSWGVWGQCSATCQLTSSLPTQQRTRNCVGATFGGNCNGQAAVGFQTCSLRVFCPGTISDWSSWGTCSDVCNNLVTPPYQTRSRSCIGYSSWDPNYLGCPGISTTEQQPCNTLVGCSGTYDAWSSWSGCSESCQSNDSVFPFQIQTRQCVGSTLGAGCAGPSSKTESCNIGVSCPGILTSWERWGQCSATCQLTSTLPTQQRSRICVGATFGGNCNGLATIESQKCSIGIYCPGTISDWSSWGACSDVCNNLVTPPYQTRSRICVGYSSWDLNYFGCPDISKTEQLPCNTMVGCSGTYSAWSAWSGCSESCQSNTILPPFHIQTRLCIGSTLGAGCFGPSSQTESCNFGVSCPGILSSWEAWGQCSATCQLTLTLPFQQRIRNCVGATLGGNCNEQATVESQKCNIGIFCPGTISDWSSWGACSNNCNNLVTPPIQTRSRSCIEYSLWDSNYLGCPGFSKTEQQPCNRLVGCLGTYSAWSDWSDCSETCQSNITVPPFRTQTRQCFNSTLGAGCYGPSSLTVSCSIGVSCPGVISSWGEWGQCSATCQLTSTLPTQQRSRVCVGATLGGNCNGQATIGLQACNIGTYCPGKISEWSLWSECSGICNNIVTPPYQTRSRLCTGCSTWDPNYFGCPGISKTEQLPCNILIGCLGTYGTWNTWSSCSESCQSNINVSPIQTQTRQCFNSTLGAGCSGPSYQTLSCNIRVSCPGVISSWGAWGQCSETCQLTSTLPTQQRSRVCEGATLGGNCNGEATIDLQTCSNGIYCPGKISEWSLWGACSDVCNNLVKIPYQARSRLCIGYSSWDPYYMGCPGISKTEQQPCNRLVGCLGTYGTWSAWSDCSETCQSNITVPPFRTQTRQCFNSTLGAGCSGPSFLTESCNIGVSCPGTISLWGSWGQCSATCQLTSTLPTQQRSRVCMGASLGGDCNGQTTIGLQTCSVGVICPGTISDWSFWSACSYVCNNLVTPPYQTRSRSCISYSSWDSNYLGCPGVLKNEQQPCNTLIGCLGTYGAWSPWSGCSESCQSNSNIPPIQTQTRQCVGSTLGAGCSGPSSQTLSCNVGIPCPGILGDWTTWGACSASCQLDFSVPKQTSTRTCSVASLGGNCNGATLIQSKNCNANVYCPGTLSGWSSWGLCSASCKSQTDGPYQYRSQSCVGASTWNPNYEGCNNASLNEYRLCNQNVPCPGVYSVWSEWSTCSESCQLSIEMPPFQFRSRNCEKFTSGGVCVGVSSETRSCNLQVSCPGQLTNWTPWSQCPATCQTTNGQYNMRYRKRECLNTSFNGNCEGAITIEEIPCAIIFPCFAKGTSSAITDTGVIQKSRLSLFVFVFLCMHLFTR